MWFLGQRMQVKTKETQVTSETLDMVHLCNFAHFMKSTCVILEQGNVGGKKAVPWVDDGLLSWFLFDVRKQSTEHQWRLQVALCTQTKVYQY